MHTRLVAWIQISFNTCIFTHIYINLYSYAMYKQINAYKYKFIHTKILLLMHMHIRKKDKYIQTYSMHVGQAGWLAGCGLAYPVRVSAPALQRLLPPLHAATNIAAAGLSVRLPHAHSVVACARDQPLHGPAALQDRTCQSSTSSSIQ